LKRLSFASDELTRLKEQNLYRETFCMDSAQGPKVRVDGKELLCFCSNDYLGLANDPRVREAATRAIEKFGVGAGASRLINGTMRLHEELEQRLAAFKGCEDSLVFPTGYMANVGVISALVGREDTVIIDRLDHASIIDGCRLSGARLRVYRHCDVVSLEKALTLSKKARRRLIVTDGVFSMDGDIAPLNDIVKLAECHDAILMVDDAHGTGVLGKNGRGALEYLGVEDKINLCIGTLSKAVGSLGGFVVGPCHLIDYLRNCCRSFIYTTALSPPMLAGAIAALDIIRNEPERRVRLASLVTQVRDGLRSIGIEVTDSPSPIISVEVGKTGAAVSLAKRLRSEGILVVAIRPPTVPEGTARLRVSIQSQHTEEDVCRLVSALKAAR